MYKQMYHIRYTYYLYCLKSVKIFKNMFTNIWGWYPENIQERSASVKKFDVLIKRKRVYALHISSFSLLTMKVIKERKHVFLASIACWKPRQSLWEFSSRWKPSLICFHWSAFELSQTFATVFTRLWRHGKHILFLKCNENKIILKYLNEKPRL